MRVTLTKIMIRQLEFVIILCYKTDKFINLKNKENHWRKRNTIFALLIIVHKYEQS